MVWKVRTPSGDTGDTSHFGADDLNKISNAFSGTDVDDVDMACDWAFQNAKLQMWNPAKTFKYSVVPSAIAANRTVTEPLLTGNDTRVYQAHPQPLTQKTIDFKDNTLVLRFWNVICFKVGTTYYAYKYDGTLLSSSTTAQTVLQAAFTEKGTIYFAHNRIDQTEYTYWNLSAGFTGFTITGDTFLIAEVPDRVFIGVPTTFNGTLFTVTDGPFGIDGLSFFEQSPASRNWNCIKFQIAGTAALVFSMLENFFIWDCNTAIELECANTRWINSNRFRDITIYGSRKGILFDQQSGEISQNIFDNVNIQCMTGVTTHGFQDIPGTSNIFIGCSVWDMDVSNSCIETSITSAANGTIIIGGKMTGNNGQFVNQGVKTIILASFQGIAANTVLTPDVIKYGTWMGTAPNVTNADGLLNGRITESIVGTGASTSVANSTGGYRDFDTGATTGGIYGHRMGMSFMQRLNNCYYKTALYLNNITGVRIFAGFKAGTGAPTASGDPLNVTEGCALWLDSAVSSSWKVMHNDASGASTVDTLTMTAATATLYPIEIYARSDNRFRVMFNGVSTDYTTNIPASTTNLGFYTQIESTTSGSKTMRCYYEIIRNDK